MKKLNPKNIKKQLEKVVDPESGIDIVSLGFIKILWSNTPRLALGIFGPGLALEFNTFY
ncbi:MAG: hypothetical protein U9O78_00690 [Patescibacteria group bacterium]|nr:hypothetical protein [Patescibacteria group bacterium]